MCLVPLQLVLLVPLVDVGEVSLKILAIPTKAVLEMVVILTKASLTEALPKILVIPAKAALEILDTKDNGNTD